VHRPGPAPTARRGVRKAAGANECDEIAFIGAYDGAARREKAERPGAIAADRAHHRRDAVEHGRGAVSPEPADSQFARRRPGPFVSGCNDGAFEPDEVEQKIFPGRQSERGALGQLGTGAALGSRPVSGFRVV
jgi:hypothetical protein